MSGALDRLSNLASHLAPGTGSRRDALLRKSPDDVVITAAVRSPLTKARKGLLKDTPVEDLIIAVLKGIQTRSSIDPSLVEDIIVGNVLSPHSAFQARAAVLASGFPPTTASSVCNRWCSSGLLAIQAVAHQILAGSIDVGIAVGAESMSLHADGGAPPFGANLTAKQEVRDIAMPMGWTSENVAAEFGVTRAAQDAFAAGSFQRAERSQAAGWPEDEIVPVATTWVDPKTGEKKAVTAERDDGVRAGTTAESLGKIRPAFPQWAPSTTTGGNASQITDGAAAVLLMRRSVAERLGQVVIGKFVASTVTGLAPRIMGIGPTVAIPKLLGKVGLAQEEVDIFEINEAFASMGVYCVEKLALDPAKVNPRGGAIAFGHPLGCTGVRQVVTALSELRRTGKKVAVTSMCVGTGMGMAGLFISEA